MKSVRDLLAGGAIVALGGCAAGPAPADIEPAAPPTVAEVVIEPEVEPEPEPVREPEPPLAERWAAPFAVSSAGRVASRTPRSVTVLGSDPAIAAGLAALNDAPSPASGSSTSAAAAPTAPVRSSAGSSASVAAADTPPTPAASSRAAPTVGAADPAAGAVESNAAPAASPPLASRGATGSSAASAGAPGTAPPIRLIGDPIEPEESDARPVPSAVTSTAAGAPTPSRPAPDRAAAADRAAGATSSRSAPGPSARVRNYTVEPGDSWIGIARDHGVSFSQLLEANPGANPERIRIGQVLRIPPSTRAAAERSHRVANGDTLSEIAERYGVPVRSIRAANDLSSDVIRPGQLLRIPAD